LTDFFPASEAMPNDCRPPYAGSFAAPSGIAIDPLGYVTLCHGIPIGNIKKTAIGEILANYRLEDHPILNAVATKGPLGLLELAGSENMRLRSAYITSCQLCYVVRKHLRTKYPDYLAPSNCYDSRIRSAAHGCLTTNRAAHLASRSPRPPGAAHA